jgi:hypothetical protein
LLPLALAIQADLLAVTIFFFFFCQVGQVGTRRTGTFVRPTFIWLFLRLCVCVYVLVSSG